MVVLVYTPILDVGPVKASKPVLLAPNFDLISDNFCSQCQMPDIMSVGLHKMYLACKQNSCFPGPLPDRDDENVSIHDILRCLGLIANPHDLQLDSSRTNLQGDGAKKKDNKEDEPSTTQDMLSSAPLLSSTSTTNSPFSALPEDITVNFSDGLFPGLYY